ncbi:hypothetical protein EVG20_g11584 [Dentipellis fragilis]|uniref:Uncharacterized protein n=1 Tax=Dentipellis fragilis TaxID=205917 RepID=A0A4Y9XKW8_9AGAM|nr:hypothetical protein EVG20_g11584 [Dentipellis fragilis]
MSRMPVQACEQCVTKATRLRSAKTRLGIVAAAFQYGGYFLSGTTREFSFTATIVPTRSSTSGRQQEAQRQNTLTGKGHHSWTDLRDNSGVQNRIVAVAATPRRRHAVGTQASMLCARRERCAAEGNSVSDLDFSRANSADRRDSCLAHRASLACLLILTTISLRDMTAAAASDDPRQPMSADRGSAEVGMIARVPQTLLLTLHIRSQRAASGAITTPAGGLAAIFTHLDATISEPHTQDRHKPPDTLALCAT